MCRTICLVVFIAAHEVLLIRMLANIVFLYALDVGDFGLKTLQLFLVIFVQRGLLGL